MTARSLGLCLSFFNDVHISFVSSIVGDLELDFDEVMMHHWLGVAEWRTRVADLTATLLRTAFKS